MQNPILDLIKSLDPRVVDTRGMMSGANSRFESGFNSLQSVADNLDKVRTNRNIRDLISNTDMSDPYAGQQTMLSNLLGLKGVDTKDAMSISSGIANPLIARNNRTEDNTYRDNVQTNLQNYRNKTSGETARHNAASEKKGFAPKGYGAYTNEYGETVMYNKDTGKVLSGGSVGTGNTPVVSSVGSTVDNGSTSNVGGLTRIPPKYIETIKVKTPDGNGGTTEKSVTVDKRNPSVALKHQGSGYYSPVDSNTTSVVPEKQSTDQEKGVKSVSNVVGGFSRVKDLFSPELVGPYDSRMTGVKSFLGMDEPSSESSTTRGNALESATAQIVNDIRHSQFGSALTGYEIEEWKKGVPDVGMGETEFIPKWNQFIDTTIDHGNDALKNLRNQKRYHDAKQLENEIKSLENYKLNLQDYADTAEPSVMSPLGRDVMKKDITEDPIGTLMGVFESATPGADASELNDKSLTGYSEPTDTGKVIGGTAIGALMGGRGTDVLAKSQLRRAGTVVDDIVSKNVKKTPVLNKGASAQAKGRETVRRDTVKPNGIIGGGNTNVPKGFIGSAVDAVAKAVPNGFTKTVQAILDRKFISEVLAPISKNARADLYKRKVADLMDSGLTYKQSMMTMEKFLNEAGINKAGTAIGAIVGSQSKE